MLHLFYEDQKFLTKVPSDYEELERTARRLFGIPESEKLIMATEIRSTSYSRLDIDPKTWPIIKDSVAAVWIRKSLTNTPPPYDTKGSEDPVSAWEKRHASKPK